MSLDTGSLPADWYLTSFASSYDSLYFEEGGEEQVDLALELLEPEGDELVVDLACGIGIRTLELSRRGFEVLGVEACEFLLEVVEGEARIEGLSAQIEHRDPRALDHRSAFDLALSMGGGVLGHAEERYVFEDEEADACALARIGQALRSTGRLLLQVPNLLLAEAGLPEEGWLRCGEAVELVEQSWDEDQHRLEGTRRCMLECELAEDAEPISFCRRLYSLEELAGMLNEAGFRLADVFDEEGEPCVPSEEQLRLYVVAERV